MLPFLQISLPFFVLFVNFIYSWLHRIFVVVLRLSLAAASGGYSLWCEGFSPPWLLLAERWL